MTKSGLTARMEKITAFRDNEESEVAKKRIVRTGNVTERGSLVGDPYGRCSEPASEPCARSTA